MYPSPLLFHFHSGEGSFGSSGSFAFHVNHKVSLSISAKQCLLGFVGRNALKPQLRWRRVAILTVSSFPVHGHGLSLHLFSSSFFSFSRTTFIACQIISCGPRATHTLFFFLFFPVYTSVQILFTDSLFTAFIFFLLHLVSYVYPIYYLNFK